MLTQKASLDLETKTTEILLKCRTAVELNRSCYHVILRVSHSLYPKLPGLKQEFWFVFSAFKRLKVATQSSLCQTRDTGGPKITRHSIFDVCNFQLAFLPLLASSFRLLPC